MATRSTDAKSRRSGALECLVANKGRQGVQDKMHGHFGQCTLLVAMVLGIAMSVNAGTLPPRKGSSSTLQVSLPKDIRSTDPGVNRDGHTDAVMLHIVEGLVAYREDGSPGPLLADSINVSPDGKTYTFRLRSGVHFHNGAPLTANEVVWTWRRYLDPKTGWECLADFNGTHGAKIESVTATATDTVVMQLDRPKPLLLTQMSATQCGGSGILHPSSVNADGSWRAPVGTGPYKLKEWKRGQYIDLDAFDAYQSLAGERDGNTGAKIALTSRLRWLIIRDPAARVAALVKGQIDVMPEVPTAEMQRLRKVPGVIITAKPLLGVFAILIQSQNALLSDVRIRKALALSLDRKIISDLVSGGVGSATASIIPSSSPFHSVAQNKGMNRDLKQAKLLLAQAGYKGQTIVLTTNRSYPAMYNQALHVQAMAREAGLNIRLEVIEWASELDRYHSGKYELMSFAYSSRTDASLNFSVILGKVWSNPAAIKLAEFAEQASDRAARQRAFDQLHQMMLDDCPLIALFSLSDVNAVRSNVRGFRSWSLGRPRFWGVERLPAR